MKLVIKIFSFAYTRLICNRLFFFLLLLFLQSCNFSSSYVSNDLFYIRTDVFVNAGSGSGTNWNASVLYAKLVPSGAIENPAKQEDAIAGLQPEYSSLIECGLSPQGELTSILYFKDIKPGTYDMYAFVDLASEYAHIDHDSSKDCFCHRHGVPADCRTSSSELNIEAFNGHQDHDADLHADHDAAPNDKDGVCTLHGGVKTFVDLNGNNPAVSDPDNYSALKLMLDRTNEADDCYCQTHGRKAYCSLHSKFNVTEEAHTDHDSAPDDEDGWCSLHGLAVLPHSDHDLDNVSTSDINESSDGYCNKHQIYTLLAGDVIADTDHDSSEDGFCYKHGQDWNQPLSLDEDGTVVVNSYITSEPHIDHDDPPYDNDGYCDLHSSHIDHDIDDKLTASVDESRDGVCSLHSDKVYTHDDHDTDDVATLTIDESADGYCNVHSHPVFPHIDDHDDAVDGYCTIHNIIGSTYKPKQYVHRLKAKKLANVNTEDSKYLRADKGDPFFAIPSIVVDAAHQFENNSRKFRSGSLLMSKGWGANGYVKLFDSSRTSCTFIKKSGEEITIDWKNESYDLNSSHDPCDPCDVEHDGILSSKEDCDGSLYSSFKVDSKIIKLEYPLYKDVNEFQLYKSHKGVSHFADDYDNDDYIDDGTFESSINENEKGRDPFDDEDGWEEWFSF